MWIFEEDLELAEKEIEQLREEWAAEWEEYVTQHDEVDNWE